MKKAIIERLACTSHLETAEGENDDEEDREMTLNKTVGRRLKSTNGVKCFTAPPLRSASLPTTDTDNSFRNWH
jgi:hypothetical protein